jgi:hypothetical protein
MPTAGGGAVAGASGSGENAVYQGVLQHHGDRARDGFYIDRAFTQKAARNLALDSSFTDATYASDNVNAQPLYLVGTGGKPDQVFVFTESNRVYAFDAGTGTLLFGKSFGTPLGTSPCAFSDNGGFGITGTPVIDADSRTIYFVNASATGGSTVHAAHAISADTGEELAGWPLNLSLSAKAGSTSFDSTFQKQRAALSMVGGKVFIGFGGHIGDCGGYHGWVVAIDPATKAVNAWAARAVGGAVWGASGFASDGTSLFFATGNSKANASDAGNTSSGDGGGTWADSQTIFKFSTSLTPPAMAATTDFFVPANWVALDDGDQDIGGTSPILLDVPGATPSELVVSLGKDGNAYLLERANLGGLDATPLAKLKVSSGAIINAMAGYHTQLASYVVFKGSGSGCPAGQSGGLSAFRIDAASPPTLSLAWCAGPAFPSSPSVTSTDTSGTDATVWVLGNDNELYGLDGDTGASVLSGGSALATVATIQTPIVAKGRLFVASSSELYAFKP